MIDINFGLVLVAAEKPMQQKQRGTQINSVRILWSELQDNIYRKRFEISKRPGNGTYITNELYNIYNGICFCIQAI